MSDIKRKNRHPKDKNGNNHGKYLIYYDNGLLSYRENWFHGRKHGISESYHYDRSLHYRGYYNMGIKVGFWNHSNIHKFYYLCLI